MILKYGIFVIFLIITGCSDFYQTDKNEEITDFEKMLSGFQACDHRDIYLDYSTKEPIHAYFKDRDLKPHKIDEDFAYFLLDENFYGIKVHELMIPASTYDVHALYLKESIPEIKIQLRKYFPSGFYETGDDDLGEKPFLLSDPIRSDWSILICSPREGGI